MALDDEKLFEIPPTDLSIETVHETNGPLITVSENPEKRYTIGLGKTDEAEKYVSTLKKGDKIIVASHGRVGFIYGPIEEEKLCIGKYWA